MYKPTNIRKFIRIDVYKISIGNSIAFPYISINPSEIIIEKIFICPSNKNYKLPRSKSTNVQYYLYGEITKYFSSI